MSSTLTLTESRIFHLNPSQSSHFRSSRKDEVVSSPNSPDQSDHSPVPDVRSSTPDGQSMGPHGIEGEDQESQVNPTLTPIASKQIVFDTPQADKNSVCGGNCEISSPTPQKKIPVELHPQQHAMDSDGSRGFTSESMQHLQTDTVADLPSEIEKNAVSKVAVLESTLLEVRVKRRRMEDQMHDLIDIDKRKRQHRMSLSEFERAEKDAQVELAAAQVELARAEERVRAAEARGKQVREEKAVAVARQASLAQQHTQAKESLQSSKDAIKGLLAGLARST